MSEAGFGNSPLWLRLPNLFLAGWLLLVILRIGRLAGCRSAGWATALLVLLLPSLVMASVFRGPFFTQLVFSAWFAERLATYLVERRANWISVAVSGALAIWTGR